MPTRQAFISYSQKDRDYALQLMDILKAQDLTVWIDFEKIRPGEFIARNIEKGIGNSNYYFLVVTRSSVESKWVQRELAMAFDLSRDGRIALIPAVFEEVPLPLELRGLLFIDFSKNFSTGASRLISFLADETRVVAFFVAPAAPPPRPGCEARLAGLAIPDLRYEIASRLDKDDFNVVWFDTFGMKMEDEINPVSTGVISVQIIARAQNRRTMDKLLKYLCRQRSDLGSP